MYMLHWIQLNSYGIDATENECFDLKIWKIKKKETNTMWRPKFKFCLYYLMIFVYEVGDSFWTDESESFLLILVLCQKK